MSDLQNPAATTGGASAPPRVVFGRTGPDGHLLARDSDVVLGTYKITSTWKVRDRTLASIDALVDGEQFQGLGSAYPGVLFKLANAAQRSAVTKKGMATRTANAAKKKEQAAAAAVVASASSDEHEAVERPGTVEEVACLNLRRNAVELLKAVDPAAYEQYTQIKYRGTDCPSIKQRRAAYEWAFSALLGRCYNRSI